MTKQAATIEQEAPKSEDKPDMVAEFKDRYGVALAEAYESEEMTKTERWQALFSERQNAERTQRTHLSTRLRGFATILEDSGLTEDDEKSLGDVKKACTELREQSLAFERNTLDPIIKPVRDCESIIETYSNRAGSEAARSPLLSKGLIEKMNAAFARVHVPKYDSQTGRVTVEEPAKK